MAHEYTSWVFAQGIRGAGRKFVLLALADRANGDGYSYPGQKTLAEMTGQSERSVREHIEWLEERGYLRRKERRRKDGTRTSDGYYLPPMDSTGNIRRWSTTGSIRRSTEEATSPDQHENTPPTTTGNIRRQSTGRIRQTNRQILPKSPAESAGHELPGEPSETEPSASSSTKPQSTEPPEAAAAADQQQDPKPPPTPPPPGQPLATDHPAFALLVTFRNLHTQRPNQAQFLNWSKTISADIHEHGEAAVLEALTATIDNFPTLNYPFSFYRACLKQARASPSFFDVPGQPPPPALDPTAIDKLIADAKEGTLT